MGLIWETTNFTVESHEQPFVSRADGGHVRIVVKDTTIGDRTQLNPAQAIELMRLTMIVGEALQSVMNAQGIPVVKINYQDMGNWAWKTGKAPLLHIHIFGRASNAKYQVWPEAVYLPDRSSGFYDNFEPLNQHDLALLQAEIKHLFSQDKNQDSNWFLGAELVSKN